MTAASSPMAALRMTRREAAALLLFLVTRAALLAVGTAAVIVLPSVEGPEYAHLLDGGPALDMWYRWDTGFYTSIATYGYDWFNERRPADDLAFLPLYPLLVHLASGLTPTGCGLSPYWSTCTTLGGLLISNLALLAALFLLYDLARGRFGSAVAWRAALLLMITPNTIFLSGVYTEALFLLLCILVFWLLERDRFILALLVAGLASLTRSVGVALYPALLYAAWVGASAPPQRIARAALAHLPPALFAGYILAAGFYVGEPLAYFTTYNATWGRPTGTPIAVLAQYFSGEPVALFGWWLSWIDLAAAAVYLLLALAVFRLDRSWGLFALFAVLIPIASGTLIGMPRFGAVVFPFYIAIARWIDRPWRQVIIYAASIGLALLFTARFVTWRWIA